MNSFLEIENLHRSFGKTKALNGLSLSIPENSISAFVGANGAGKTTTFSVLGQFIRPNQGELRVGGRSLAEFKKQGEFIGILPQDMQYFEDRSVHAQLSLFAKLSGLSSSKAKEEASRVLSLVRLEDKASVKPSELSRGMLVRLGVAQALIAEPKLILLDEPTAGLDPSMVASFRSVVEGLRGKATVVISSHNLSELEELCDYVCIIDKGKLVYQGRMQEVLSKSSSVIVNTTESKVDLSSLSSELRAIELSQSEDAQIVATFDPKLMSIEEVNKQLLPALISRGIGITSIRSTQSLEDWYFELLEKSQTL